VSRQAILVRHLAQENIQHRRFVFLRHQIIIFGGKF
jgi:hypothetical protein